MKTWWKIGQRKRNRKQVYEHLQSQRLLLQQGMAAYARIIEIEEKSELLKGYVELKVWIAIRLQGRLLYQQVQTMVNADKLPVQGEIVPVRILADNTSMILILS
jgi:hypothetical protein